MTIWADLAARYDPANSYVSRATDWSRDKTGTIAWSKQAQIQQSVIDNRYTAVRSAHDLGKSKIAAEIMAWWIDVHPVGEAFVVSTAPSAAQVSAILWREVAKSHRLGGLMGKINRAGYPQWYIGAELVGYGRKPADYEDSAFQGIHAKYVLVVIDEACGVSKHLFDAVDSLVTNEYSRVLAIGNPDNPGSHFAAVCRPGTAANAGWNVIALDGLESPNMTEAEIVGPDSDAPRYPMTAALMAAEGIDYSTEEIPEQIRPYLLSPLWIEERIARWAGVSETEFANTPPEARPSLVARRAAASSLFTAKVRGVFPPSTSDGVIPLGWVHFAFDRWRRFTDRYGTAPTPQLTAAVPNPTCKVVGVDVARGGEDETVFAIRYGDYIAPLERFRLADTTETTDAAAAHLQEPHCLAVVDTIGIGAGVFDLLRRYRKRGQIEGAVIGFTASAATWRRDATSGSYKFFNDRAAAWWHLRELLDPSARHPHKLMLPPDERLEEELCAPKWKHLANGTIQIESKDEIKKRLGRSTDSADAVIQAFRPSGRVFADPEAAMVDDMTRRRNPPNTATGATYPSGYAPMTAADIETTTAHPATVVAANTRNAQDELDDLLEMVKAPSDDGFRKPRWNGRMEETEQARSTVYLPTDAQAWQT